MQTLTENNLEYHEFDFVDINDNRLIEYIKKVSVIYFVFTGGGILKQEILNSGKKFIHMHSGIAPQYRGSTCIYYSILDNDNCGVTAFLMNEKFNQGEERI